MTPPTFCDSLSRPFLSLYLLFLGKACHCPFFIKSLLTFFLACFFGNFVKVLVVADIKAALGYRGGTKGHRAWRHVSALVSFFHV